MRVVQSVALVHHGDSTWVPGGPALASEIEGVSLNALDAFARVDVLLDGDLISGASLELATDADVGSLSVFADHDQIDRRRVFEWCQPRGKESRRTKVDPEIELKTQTEQEARRVVRICDAGIAHSAQVDRVSLLQFGKHRVRKNLTALEIALGAQVIADEVQ